MNSRLQVLLPLAALMVVVCKASEYLSEEAQAYQQINEHLKQEIPVSNLLDADEHTDEEIKESFAKARELLESEEQREFSLQDKSLIAALQAFLKLPSIEEIDELCKATSDEIMKNIEKAITVDPAHWSSVSRIDDILWCFHEKRNNVCGKKD